MTQRSYNRVAVAAADQGIVTGYKIVCTKCNASDILSAPKRGGLPSEVIEKKFTQRGWVTTREPGKGLCPECGRRHKRIVVQAAPGIVAASLKSGAITPEAFIAVAELAAGPTHKEDTTMSKIEPVPPRTMSREDRRIIFEKLNEVYVNEKTGYSKGWSDRRVAEDLGVPQAWVAEIRDQNHGPDNASEEAREWVEKALQIEAKINDLAGDFAARMAGFTQQLEALKAEGRQLGKAGAHIQKQFR